jgi:hypothetical protein
MAAPSSDEEEDLSQLAMIEQKLLAHDPSFTALHTHASLTSKRSELISTLRPTYDESNAEGTRYFYPSFCVAYLQSRTLPHPSQHGALARL